MNSKYGNIETIVGRIINVVEPKPDDFDLIDIATSLSRLCRFNGHTRLAYSVAEHSVMVAQLMERLFEDTPNQFEAFRWGLLHDAPEAYIGDIPRPVKRQFEGVKELEAGLMKAIAECYGLTWPCPWEFEVKLCDVRCLLWEADALMPSRGQSEFYSGHDVDFLDLSGLENPLLEYQETTERAAKELFIDAFQNGGVTGRLYSFSCPSRN